MAHAELPKLVPIDNSKMCPNDFSKMTLAEVLQSDPVKRLFNQPNIIVKTIPLNSSSVQSKNIFESRKNGASVDLNEIKRPELSILPIKCDSEKGEEDNLLPSKKEGKSEITLLPVKRVRKECGHYEPCENIVCDVAVQQYVDHEGSSPMLAFNIEEHEINAPVAKHCKNENCDALSIDHNRCRRAVIRLYRCDKYNICDICGHTFQTRKSQMRHKKCKRKDEYRHNNTDGAQILKERMRVRELQMLEAAKTKRNYYLDPISGYDRAMKVLQNNNELIVIPKSLPPQPPIITITSVPNNQKQQRSYNVSNALDKYYSNISGMVAQQHGLNQSTDENDISAKQLGLHDLPYVTTSIPSVTNQNQFTTLPQPALQPLQLNDWLMSQSHVLPGAPIQPKPFLTPIRVVPITNLITQPSLMHQTQGVPKFCIVADSVTPPLTLTKPQIAQQSTNNSNLNDDSVDEDATVEQKNKKDNLKKIAKRKLRKHFKCNFCSKRFTTDWYFKMHVAMHKGEVNFSCWICKKAFTNRYDMKKHMINEHKNEDIPCDVCNHICDSYTSYERHVKVHAVEKSYKCSDCDFAYVNSANLKHHRRKCHGKMECKYCQKEFDQDLLQSHLLSEHKVNEGSVNRAEKCDDVEVKSQTKTTGQSTEGKEDDAKKNGFASDVCEESREESKNAVEI